MTQPAGAAAGLAGSPRPASSGASSDLTATPLCPPPYRAPGWLPGAHAQTIYPLLIAPGPVPQGRRERWDTPDGDFIDLDWFDPAGDAAPGAKAPPLPPLVVLFHGLEGSSDSPYARALMRAVLAKGWGGVVPHFRGCSGEANRLPRAYHSGDSDEIDWILARIAQRFPDRRRLAVGVSLGGNALLKWAGERGEAAAGRVEAIVAVSAPLDLVACGHHLARGFNRIYTHNFLKTLKAAAAAKLVRFPGHFAGRLDLGRLAAARTLYEFDDLFTAPVHGFAGVEDYWRRASAKPWLPLIRLPALLINAHNDPFMPAGVLPGAAEVAAATKRDFPRAGGHVGFVSGSLPGNLDWLPQRILYFFCHEV